MGKDEKKRKGRRAWLADVKKNEAGEYTYEGAHYVWEEQRESRRASLGRLWRLCAAAALCTVASGCIPAPGIGNCAYVLLPYACQVAAAASVCYTLFRLSFAGERVRAYVYEGTVGKMTLRTMATLILAALVIAGELIYVLRNTAQGEAGMAALLVALEAVAAVCVYGVRRCTEKLVWKLEE